MFKICDENISNKKEWKLKKIFKVKEFSHAVLGKGLFVSIKGHLCLTKGHLANLEGQVEIKSISWGEVIEDTADSN